MPLYAMISVVNNVEGVDVKSRPVKQVSSSRDPNRFFATTEQTQGNVTQTTTVTVTVQPEKEGCMSGCMDGLKSCFGFGAKAAAGAV